MGTEEDDRVGVRHLCFIAAVIAVCIMPTLLLAGDRDSAVKYHDPIVENKAMQIIKGLQITTDKIGVYYIPEEEQISRSFVFDDIPRDNIVSDKNMTIRKRLSSEGEFVKFNGRQITYSLREREEDSLRFNIYPSKGAVVINWTYFLN